jgi:hypothetical protein
MGRIARLFGLEPQNFGQYYVYALKDTRFDPPQIFYYGKGSKDRMYAHQKEMERLMKKHTPGAMMALSCKHKRILAILDAGVQVGYEVVEEFDEEGASYRAERGYIADYGLERLTNETYGMSDQAIDRLIKRRLAR